MSLFFNFLNEINDTFKQRELSYHLNSFDTNNRIYSRWVPGLSMPYYQRLPPL